MKPDVAMRITTEPFFGSPLRRNALHFSAATLSLREVYCRAVCGRFERHQHLAFSHQVSPSHEDGFDERLDWAAHIHRLVSFDQAVVFGTNCRRGRQVDAGSFEPILDLDDCLGDILAFLGRA